MPKVFKISALLVVCCCCFLLTACSDVGYGVYIYTNGNIAQVYSVELDNEKMQSLGINKDELLNKIKDAATEKWNTASAGKDLTNVAFEPQKTENSFVAKIVFKNIEAYKTFYEIEDSNTTQDEIEQGLFFNKRIIYNGNTPFVNIDSSSIYNEILNFIANNYFGGDTTSALQHLKDVSVSTSRVYPTSYKTKTNATYHQVAGEYDIYIWQSTLEKELSSTPQNMKIWQTVYTVQNRIVWYSLGVVLTIIFGAILFIILLIKKKNTPTITKDPQQPLAQLPPKIAQIYNPTEENSPQDTPKN